MNININRKINIPQIMPQKENNEVFAYNNPDVSNNYIETSYRLMNKNKELGIICIDPKEGSTFTVKLYDEYKHLGYKFYFIFKRTISIFDYRVLTNIFSYLHPDGKMKKKPYDNKTPEFLFFTRGLNYCNTLWINDLRHPLSWDNINPFSNKIEDIACQLSASNNCNPDIFASSEWSDLVMKGKIYPQKENDKLYIYKYSNNLSAYCEIYAGLFIDLIKPDNFVPLVDYGINNKTLYTKTENLANCDTGIIALEDCRNTAILNEKQSEQILKDMCFIDSIILNQDRHNTNVCAYLDNETLEIKKLAPVFDQDFSFSYNWFNANETFEDHYYKTLHSDELYKLPRFKNMTFDEQILWAMDREKYNKLLSLGTIKLKADKIQENKQYADYINYALNRRIQDIINLVQKMK